jgi:hypothetical protein
MERARPYFCLIRSVRELSGKRLVFLSITHKLNSDHDTQFNIC